MAHPVPNAIGEAWTYLHATRKTTIPVTVAWTAVGIGLCLAGRRFADGWDFLVVLGLIWLVFVPPWVLWRASRQVEVEEVAAGDVETIALACVSFADVPKQTRQVRRLDGHYENIEIDPFDVAMGMLDTLDDGTVVWIQESFPRNPDTLADQCRRAVPSRIVQVDANAILFHPLTDDEIERRRIAERTGGLVTDSTTDRDDGRSGSRSATLPPPTGTPSTPPPAGVDLGWDDDD